jgi:hypothetical protein
VTLSPAAVIVGWGVVLPFAIWGVLRWMIPNLNDVRQRVVGCHLVGGTLLLIGSSLFPELLGGAFEAIGRPHRYWPYVHLGLILCAVGGAEMLAALLARGRALLVAGCVITFVLAVPSPILSSLALPDTRGAPRDLNAAVRGSPGSMLNLLLGEAGERCIVAAPVEMDESVWSYTGYRMLMFVWGVRDQDNLARIRWRDIYEHIPSDAERAEAQQILMNPATDEGEWNAIIERYDIDSVVVETSMVADYPIAGRVVRDASDVDYSVITTGECES